MLGKSRGGIHIFSLKLGQSESNIVYAHEHQVHDLSSNNADNK